MNYLMYKENKSKLVLACSLLSGKEKLTFFLKKSKLMFPRQSNIHTFFPMNRIFIQCLIYFMLFEDAGKSYFCLKYFLPQYNTDLNSFQTAHILIQITETFR